MRPLPRNRTVDTSRCKRLLHAPSLYPIFRKSQNRTESKPHFPSKPCVVNLLAQGAGPPLRHYGRGAHNSKIAKVEQAGGPLQRGSITRVCLLTLAETTGGAPLLAVFEKWPAAQPTPACRPAFRMPSSRPNAHV
jgi:hypothetical protein